MPRASRWRSTLSFLWLMRNLPTTRQWSDFLSSDRTEQDKGQREKIDGLWIAGPQGVLRLQRCDRVHGVGAADRVGACLGQADVADLAFGDQPGQSADGLLDG